MALNKLKFNSLNVTPTAGKAVGFNSSANGLEATLSGGAMTFIKKLTASSSSTLSFVDGSSSVVLDNTYKEYLFLFKNIHQSIDQAYFQFNFSTDGGSNYNVTKTTSAFNAFHTESDSTELVYASTTDIAQSTNFASLSILTGNGDDENQSGVFHLFNPSSTTFVKHFISDLQCNYRVGLPASVNYKVAGYGNTTSAIDAIQFKFSEGNIDAGTITLYGIN